MSIWHSSACAAEAPLDAQFAGQILQLAIAAADTKEAVVRMIGQQQFDDGAARFDHARRMCLDLQPVTHRKGTAGDQVRHLLDLDHAHPAGAAGRQAFHVAERGDRQAVPPHAGEQCIVGLGFEHSVVHFYRESCVDTVLFRGPCGCHTVALELYCLIDGVQLADVEAAATADALVEVDVVRVLARSEDRFGRAFLDARRAALAEFGIDAVGHQFGSRRRPGTCVGTSALRIRRGTSASVLSTGLAAV